MQNLTFSVYVRLIGLIRPSNLITFDFEPQVRPRIFISNLIFIGLNLQRKFPASADSVNTNGIATQENSTDQ